MLKEKLKNFNVILASGSPRRLHFFNELDLNFTVDVRPVDETFPPHLKEAEITDYLAKLKANAFDDLTEKDILVTSDTIVWFNGAAVEKPSDAEDAKRMLRMLSGQMHCVYTSVCFTSKNFQKTVNDLTEVWFKLLSEQEINYYVNNYSPFDKAGSYGIQEWLGYIGIERIEGSYFNVMGLPTRLVYKTLLEIAENAKVD